MKLTLGVRAKNPWFWVGLAGVVLTAMGVSPEMLTSWQAVADAARSLVTNPFLLGSVAVAVLGVLVDPTTSGVSDSKRALTYTTPQ